jgi:hypothetical protein
MIKILQKYLYRVSTGKLVLILFILTNLVYLFMLFVTIPKVTQFADGLKLLDLMPTGYDLEYVNNLFSTLGEQGRYAYLYYQLPVDMLYPGLYAVSYCLLFIYFLKKINRYVARFFYFSLLPVISGISDYIENIGIITLLKQYPNFTEETVAIVNTFSVLKSTTTAFYFIALLIVLIIYAVYYFRKPKK